MKRLFLAAALALAVLPLAAAETNLAVALAGPGPFAVESALLDWTDTTRQREVPVKVYFPKTGGGPFPVILFSHGLGGSREGYAYLGRHWASHGYVSIHLQHLGSDSGVLRGTDRPRAAMQSAVANLTNAVNRPLDVRFVLDQLAALNADPGPLQHRLDLEHIGMAGHSFGAHTTLAIAGLGAELTAGRLADARVTAAIAMSPAPAARGGDAPYATIHIPIFHLTGTLDDSPIGNTKAVQRRVVFDRCRSSEQFLVTFTGGDHMIFSGRLMPRGARSQDEVFQKDIRAATLAFWNAFLKDSAECHRWLADGGFAKALGTDGVFEHKLPSSQAKSSGRSSPAR